MGSGTKYGAVFSVRLSHEMESEFLRKLEETGLTRNELLTDMVYIYLFEEHIDAPLSLELGVE